MGLLTTLAPGIHTWRATHPEWHVTTELVASYVLELDGGYMVVDPLLSRDPGESEALIDELRDLTGGDDVATYVTIPYHVRDVERVATELAAPIYAHPAVAKRLDDPMLLHDATIGELPFGCEALRIGNPRRYELPLYVPSVLALVVGDSIVGVRDGLRIWEEKSSSAWFSGRFLPSISYLAELDVDHVLVTHGEPIIGNGAAALAAMLDAPPVQSLSGELRGAAVPT